MFAESPHLRAYAERRGVGHKPGSLVGVRDFVARMTGGGCDIGERGCDIVRAGVVECARKIASMSVENLEQIREEVRQMMIPDTSDSMWSQSLSQSISMDFLGQMLKVFREAVQTFESIQGTAEDTRAWDSAVDETTGATYYFRTGSTEGKSSTWEKPAEF